MKKYLKVVFTFFLVFLMTGCVRYNMEMEVKDDKSVDLKLIYAIDYSFMDQMGNMEMEDETATEESEEVPEIETNVEESEPEINLEEPTEEGSNEGVSADDYKYLEEKGFKVEEYKEEKDGKKFAGVMLTKNYKSIDDITKDAEKTINVNEILGEKDKFDDSQFYSKKNNVYKASLLFDFSQEGSEGTEGMDMSSMTNSFELKYIIKLPVKAKTNNATEVSEDGKTLTWNLKYGEKNLVEYSFALSNGLFGLDSSMVMYIGIGLCALIVIAVVVIILSKKKNSAPSPVTYSEPVVPMQSQENVEPQVTTTEEVQNNDLNNNQNNF